MVVLKSTGLAIRKPRLGKSAVNIQLCETGEVCLLHYNTNVGKIECQSQMDEITSGQSTCLL